MSAAEATYNMGKSMGRRLDPLFGEFGSLSRHAMTLKARHAQREDSMNADGSISLHTDSIADIRRVLLNCGGDLEAQATVMGLVSLAVANGMTV